ALKDGEVSSVGESDRGFFVVKLDATLAGAEAEVEGRRELTKQRMVNVESEAKAAEAAKRLRDAVAGGKPFAEALAEVTGPHASKKASGAAASKAAGGAASKGAGASKGEAAGGEPAAGAGPDDEGLRVEEAHEVTADASPIRGAEVDVAALLLSLDKPGEVP